MKYFNIKQIANGSLNYSRSRDAVIWNLNRYFPSSLQTTRNAVSATVAEPDAATVEFPREGPGVSYALNWALAGKGIIVKDKAFHNLKTSDLQKKGANVTEFLSGLPIQIRARGTAGSSSISKSQYTKLLKQVTSHISSVSNVFVHDGAICSSSKHDAKVRVISDSPSAALSLSSVLWRTPTRVISHDSCPLTVYVATSVSSSCKEILGLGSEANAGFLVADAEESSLVLCGKAFTDTLGIKTALRSLATPIISSRGGLPLSARLLVLGDTFILLFAPDDAIQRCPELHGSLISPDLGVVLSPTGIAPFFRTVDSSAPTLLKLPTSVIIASADSSGTLPSISKLSPGQAVYHFLAGYQNGNFMPAFTEGMWHPEPLDLAKALLSKLKDHNTQSFLINLSKGEVQLTGKELLKLIESTSTKNIPSFDSKGDDLKTKYQSFISSKFQDLPEEFSF